MICNDTENVGASMSYLHVLEMLHCGGGHVFVEFGARNGVRDSKTLPFERDLGWRGLLFEADRDEWPTLQTNRPNAIVYHGAVCPRSQESMVFGESNASGWSGALDTLEPTRGQGFPLKSLTRVPCYHLAAELRRHGMRTIDYMVIDTEGSELSLIEDFEWEDFDVRVVQVEQLGDEAYQSRRTALGEEEEREGQSDDDDEKTTGPRPPYNSKAWLVEFMRSKGYMLSNDYVLAYNTVLKGQIEAEDLVFVKGGR